MTDTFPYRNPYSLTKVVQRDPVLDIHSGDLVFTGTRVPVDNLLVDYLKGGDSIEEFLVDYPTVQALATRVVP